MKIQFWGATDDVTGSMTFVEMSEGYVLIDCGLNQGKSEIEELNKIPTPIKASEIKAVILTHAHLDHSGYLPKLVKDGFRGHIYSTKATAMLTRIILADSASLDKMELYSSKDVATTLQMIRSIDWHQTTPLLGGSFNFFSAGHILGASSVLLKDQGKRVVFSGDLGRQNDPLIPSPLPCPDADAVIMESTYGGKVRKGNLEQELHTLLMKISREKRVGIVASFAVARGQMLISLIEEFFTKHPEDKFRVVIDGPMMNEANHVYRDQAYLTKDPESLKKALNKIEVIEHKGQWESLRKKSGPLLIISSSGMLTGGRIARHIMNWQDDKDAILFLPGYQAEGTPGRSFQEGHRTMTGNKDELIHWKGEVLLSEAFSSHADQNELLEWTRELSSETQIFLIHGEKTSKEAFKEKLNQNGKKKVEIPARGSVFNI